MIEITLHGRGPNTMSLAMLESFERSLDQAHEEPLMITGAGDAFSAGLDLDELRVADAAHVTKLLITMERVVRKLFLHPAPTIAKVNGHAVAGGCLVVQCCDWRVCADDPSVRIGMTGVAIGLTYPPFVPAVFAQRVPPPHVETVLLGADRYAPTDALRLGLVDELAPRERLHEVARARLDARAKLPRHAYGSTKRALRELAYAVAETQRERFENEVLPAWTGKLAGRAQ
ncbi:enoyl-CoA hydratase/isomerase family protein [Sandaracinus amylolyticus]|uniref:Enoyl-CoA hydratase n=1 Tax=Sandaracinus amylolyticus TaxID=927083 RepID=A0A0F6W3Q1_9BACT|nr:enoyl-CoA hydratase/isomerase family protein [Sandaracinus amylolyticus]AKF06527.1 Enoyl-CoA hydratase [Sandaracinus amylolyticus]